jgi:acetyl esterase/lipase
MEIICRTCRNLLLLLRRLGVVTEVLLASPTGSAHSLDGRKKYKRNNMKKMNDAGPSPQSRLLVGLLRLLPLKKRLASAAAVQAQVRKLALRPASWQPNGLGRAVDVTLRRLEEWPVYFTAPAGKTDDSRYVVFLHGGGYIHEIARAHWRFIGYLTRTARVRCIVPIYPLAPGATAGDVVPATGRLLRAILEEVGDARVTVVANSAGAGLALAATQWLRDGGHRLPGHLALISPGVNASLDDPGRLLIAADDPMQAIPGIVETGRLYAGGLDLSHPYVSPLNGTFGGLPPMTLFSGTCDVLYPDSIDLAGKARAAGVPVQLYLHKGQPHNYPVLPTPEGREARAAIVRIVRGDA